MLELRGKHNSAIVYTDNIECSAIGQITTLLNQECITGSKIRVMPDVHSGAGCTIGTTMTLKDRVIPNLVGVDIGCLDGETEVLTPNGWIKISNYTNESILVYNKNTDNAFFEKPNLYIVKDADLFYHIHNKYGLDQMVSPEHKVLIWKGCKSRGYKLVDYIAEDLVNKHESLARGIAGGIKTTFGLISNDIDISDEDLRVHIMVSADGCIRDNDSIEMHFKKQRKIDRCIKLLTEANIEYRVGHNLDGSTMIYFKNRGYDKSLRKFWRASQRQLKIVCEECIHWDGTVEPDRQIYYTSDKENADLIQYAFACNNIRCGIGKQIGEKWGENWNDWYSVYTTKNQIVGLPDYRYTAYIDRIKPKIGEKKYCFNTNTGYFIIRRNNKVSITGNCGMLTVKLKEKRIDLPNLDSVIRKYVPAGFDIHNEPKTFKTRIDIESLRCHPKANLNVMRAYQSVGTLGSGNHFIEIDKDSEGNLYLVIHTGSRHLGKQVAEYYQDLGYERIKAALNDDKYEREKKDIIEKLKAAGKSKLIGSELEKLRQRRCNDKPSIPYELAYVESQDFEDYIEDMKKVQMYAADNRAEIARLILKHAKLTEVERFETIHNYIDTDNMILRKGSVSAQAGEKLLIPINMRDGSLICIGKGNPEWNYSAPHGAGRLMSRSQAKQNLTVSEFKKTMEDAGIYTTSVGRSTLDESPMAYKPMEEIVANIKDTVDIVEVIKPIYNFKAGEE